MEKLANDVSPLIFDFRDRLGSMAPGASITDVAELEVTTPDGLVGDLSIGAPQGALIDELSRLEVAVIMSGGTPNSLYLCRCRANILVAGSACVFDVVLNVWVR